jgi:hypothetical protein
MQPQRFVFAWSRVWCARLVAYTSQVWCRSRSRSGRSKTQGARPCVYLCALACQRVKQREVPHRYLIDRLMGRGCMGWVAGQKCTRGYTLQSGPEGPSWCRGVGVGRFRTTMHQTYRPEPQRGESTLGLVTTTVTREATKLIEPRRSMAKADELVLRRTLSHAPTRGIGGLCVGPGALPSCSPAHPPSRKGGAHARAEGALELRGGATARAEGALRARDRGGLRRPRGSLCDGTEGVPVPAPRGRSG